MGHGLLQARTQSQNNKQQLPKNTPVPRNFLHTTWNSGILVYNSYL